MLFSAALLVTVSLQGLDVSPQTAEVGEEVRVIVQDERGDPIVGVPVSVFNADGRKVLAGATSDGGMTFAMESAGVYRFESPVSGPRGDGSRLVRTYVVRPSSRRWLYALVCVPLGLVLLYVNGRRLRDRPDHEPLQET